MTKTQETMSAAWQHGQQLTQGGHLLWPLPRRNPPGLQFVVYQRLPQVAEDETDTPGDWLAGPVGQFFWPSDGSAPAPSSESCPAFRVFIPAGWDDEADEDAEEAGAELLGLYDALLPAFFENTPAEKDTAAHFLRLFARLVPESVRHVYEQQAALFLTWLRHSAGC